MKHFGALMLMALAGTATAADVGITLNVAAPGLYGQINIGEIPAPPAVIYAQPVIVQAQPAVEPLPPIYLHVPPGHERHWSRHCADYGACGRPVYFVREDWYQREYVPRNMHREEHERDEHRGEGWREEGRDHEHENGHDHERGWERHDHD